MANWTDEAAAIKDFYEQVAVHLYKTGQTHELLCYKDKEVKDIVVVFMNDVKRLADFDHKKAALEAFSKWASPMGDYPGPRVITATVQVSRTYGGVTMTYGHTEEFTVNSARDTTRAYAICEQEVNRMFEIWEEYSLPKQKAPIQKAAAPASNVTTGFDGEELVTFLGDTIEVESRDGKLYYKVKGGEFQKWGVRVWPETLKHGGVTVPDKPGTFQLGREVKAVRKGDKIKKVVAIL